MTSETPPYVHRVQIYYEDTDLSGAVYHANYLKYFERAREHMIGARELVRLLEEDRVGFVVYRAELTFREPARLADELEVRSTVTSVSEYRLHFDQNVWRPDGRAPIVEGVVEMVCVDGDSKLVRVPQRVMDALRLQNA